MPPSSKLGERWISLDLPLTGAHMRSAPLDIPAMWAKFKDQGLPIDETQYRLINSDFLCPDVLGSNFD
jgi:hypothetical protein